MALPDNCLRTNSFTHLKKQLKRCAPEVQYLISADAATEQRLLLLLEKVYLEARYKNNLVVADTDIALVIESSKAVAGEDEGGGGGQDGSGVMMLFRLSYATYKISSGFKQDERYKREYN